jgi:hypothetical protein
LCTGAHPAFRYPKPALSVKKMPGVTSLLDGPGVRGHAKPTRSVGNKDLPAAPLRESRPEHFNPGLSQKDWVDLLSYIRQLYMCASAKL